MATKTLPRQQGLRGNLRLVGGIILIVVAIALAFGINRAQAAPP